MSARARAVPAPGLGVVVTAAALAGAVVIGALTAYAAFVVDPLAMPAALVAALLAAVSLKRPDVGVAVGFVLLPLGTMGLAGPSTWLASTAWAAWMLLLALTTVRVRPANARLPPFVGWLLLVLASLAVALPAADFAQAAPVVRSYLTGAMLFYAAAMLITTKDGLRVALGGVALVAIIVGGMACWQFVMGGSTREGFITGTGELVSRADAGFGQPNQLGGFLVLLVPFLAAGALLAWRHRPVAVLGLALAVAGVYFSFSRSALIALLIVPLFFVRLRTALIAVPVLLVIVAGSAPNLIRERFGTLVENTGEVSSRLDFWQGGVGIWREDPLFGAGLGSFPDAYAEARRVSKQYLPDTLFEPPPHAHNVELNVLAEQGLIGFVPLAGLFGAIGLAGVRLRRSPRRDARLIGTATVATLAAFLVHNQFDVTLLESTGSFFFALFGLTAARMQIEDGHPHD